MPDRSSMPDRPPDQPPKSPREGARPSRLRSELLIAVLVGLLGFALAVSVRAARSPSGLAVASQSDLVRILAELDQHSQQLQGDLSRLEASAAQLRSGASSGIALQQAAERVTELGILAGVVPAQGPGIVLTVSDGRRGVSASVLVDALEELRDAGAEAIDLGGVRVVESTALLDRSAGLAVDGHLELPPYRLTAIGDPRTLSEALAIPGGVIDRIDSQPGARARVQLRSLVRVLSLRPLPPARYARPAPVTSGAPR